MRVWTRIFGYKGYRQFVVICHPRTGSNMLSSYLNSHPNIKMHGEMFSKLNGRSIRDIYKVFRKNKPRQIKASGFKLFYTHPEDGNQEEMLRLIERMPQPVIIHLIRKDKLRMMASLKIALSTDVWGLKEGHAPIPADQKKVNIAPEEALKFLADIIHYELRTEARFKGGHYLRLTYEDLASHPDTCLSSIFKALKVSPQPAITNYVRTNPEPLHELISNYQELVDQGIVQKFKAASS